MDKCFPTNFSWFLSVLLPYCQEIFPCLPNLAAIAVLIEDVLKLSFGEKITIFTSHQVKQLLNGIGHLSMSDQRILRYQVVLMENPGLIVNPCEVLNPATLLPTPTGPLPFHSFLGPLDKTLRGIVEEPLTNPFTGWIEGFPIWTEKAEEVVKKRKKSQKEKHQYSILTHIYGI